MSRGPDLLIRVNGGGSVGLGHLMRCLALAQEWITMGGRAAFVTGKLPSTIRRQLVAASIDLIDSAFEAGGQDDARNLARLARRRCAVVVIDGYSFNSEYQRTARESTDRLMVIDDHGQIGSYETDLILDQNLDADATRYRQRPEDSSLLLGSRFMLLRSEFKNHHRRAHRKPEAPVRVLVTFGGSDQTNEAAKVIQALALLDSLDFDVRVAVGAGSPSIQALNEITRGVDWIRVEHAVTDMAPIMAWADLAISAAGSVCWEFAYMGLPMLLVPIATNQEPIARSLARHGVAINLGFHTEVEAGDIGEALQALLGDPECFRTMTARGFEIVDGYGPRRVVDTLLDRDTG